MSETRERERATIKLADLAETRKRMARSFAAEWLRPDAPDQATTALVDTLSTAMLSFYACARGVEERALLTPSAKERVK